MATFKEAFASARKSGKKVFTWNGKRYNTQLKESGRQARAAKQAAADLGRKSGATSTKGKAPTKRTSKVKPNPSKRSNPMNTARAKQGQRYVNRNKKK